MRILQIHPFMKSEALSPKAGGMQRASLRLTRALMDRGHQVKLLPIPEGVGTRLAWEIAPERVLDVEPAMRFPVWQDLRWWPAALLRLRPLPKSWRESLYDILALNGLRSAVRAFRPDVIHNQLARAAFPRLANALGLRGNLVLTHRHGEVGEGLPAYDRIVFNSQSALDRILAESGIPRGRARCVYNAVEPLFASQPVEEDAPREGICYVGAVRRRKGIDLVLDAWRADAALARTPLYICGAGDDMPLVDAAVREGLPVHALGQLEPEELMPRLMRAELVVIPSRLEGFSTALLEGLCCGAPVVGWAPQVRELESLLGMPVGRAFDGRTQDAAQLAEEIRLAREDLRRGAFARMRLAETVRARFSMERYALEYEAVYREVMAGR